MGRGWVKMQSTRPWAAGMAETGTEEPGQHSCVLRCWGASTYTALNQRPQSTSSAFIQHHTVPVQHLAFLHGDPHRL